MRVEWAGEELELLAQRAVWWPRGGALMVADLHLGKAAAFRSAGVPVPHGTTAADLSRLSGLLEATGARVLVILGDLLHAPTGRAKETMDAVAAWRAGADRAGVEMLLVRGNHDRRSGDPPPEWRMAVVDGPFGFGPFTLVHEPRPARRGEWLVAGHLHPGVSLQRADGRAGGMRAACFWARGGSGADGRGGFLILPAFGVFTGIKAVRPRVGDRVFAVGPERVVEVRGAA